MCLVYIKDVSDSEHVRPCCCIRSAEETSILWYWADHQSCKCHLWSVFTSAQRTTMLYGVEIITIKKFYCIYLYLKKHNAEIQQLMTRQVQIADIIII